MSTPAIKIGELAKFRGYVSDPGENPALNPGDTVRVERPSEDGGFQVYRVDANGAATDRDAQGNVIGEIVWTEELEALPQEAAAETAPATAAADDAAPVAKAKGGKKAKAAKAAAEPATVAAEAVKPAKSAKAAKTKPSADTSPTAVAASIKPVAGTTVFQHSPLVRDILESVAGQDGSEQHAALVAAKTLVNRVDETYYTLGGVLQFIKEQGVYKAIGYDGKRGFADYAKAELDVDYRKAQDLISIYETVQRAGLNEQRLSEIGWSKARQIVRIGATEEGMVRLKEDFDDLVDLAGEKTRDELIGVIKTKYDTVTSRNAVKVKKTSFSFHLIAEQAAGVEAAFEEAKQLAGSDDPNDIFAYIVSDWRMMQSGAVLTPEQQVAALAERLGLTLEIKGAAAPASEVVHAE